MTSGLHASYMAGRQLAKSKTVLFDQAQRHRAALTEIERMWFDAGRDSILMPQIGHGVYRDHRKERP